MALFHFSPRLIFLSGLLCVSLIEFGNCGNEAGRKLPQLGRAMRTEFFIDKDYIQLNHGSYGTYPRVVGQTLREYQERSEYNPDLWIRRDSKTELGKVRALLAKVVNAETDDVVVVPNTTSGINAVFRSLVFAMKERILHLTTIYNSMNAIIQYLIDYSDKEISSVVFNATYPMSNTEFLETFEAFLDEIHDPERPIKIALIDHITSVPSVVIPIDKVIPMLHRRNIRVLIDGAHAIGQIPIDLAALKPDYYVTNAHKWLYAARGCALLYVDKKFQGEVHPAHINSGYKQPADFQNEFLWTGTIDYSPYMTVPTALKFREEAGGEEVIMNYTHNLAIQGGNRMAEIFGTRVIQEEDQIGCMVDVQLPIGRLDDPRVKDGNWWIDQQLYGPHNYTFSSVYEHNGLFWVRMSTQIYNDLSDFEASAQHFLGIINDHGLGF